MDGATYELYPTTTTNYYLIIYLSIYLGVCLTDLLASS
jgi:hypothetical protein